MCDVDPCSLRMRMDFSAAVKICEIKNICIFYKHIPEFLM